MKKNILLSIALFTCFATYCQNAFDVDYKDSKDSLISTLLAEYDYYNAKRFKIKQKLDSIKIDKRIELIKEIKGKWEFTNGVCPDCIMSKGEKKQKKYIEITRTHIIFYQDSISEKYITGKEKLKFSELFNSFSGLTTIIYSDKSAWDYSINKNKNYLSVSYIGKEKEEGLFLSVSGKYTLYYSRI